MTLHPALAALPGRGPSRAPAQLARDAKWASFHAVESGSLPAEGMPPAARVLAAPVLRRAIDRSTPPLRVVSRYGALVRDDVAAPARALPRDRSPTIATPRGTHH